MADKNTVKKSFADFCEFTSQDSGIPKKQLQADLEACNIGLQKMLEKHQPKKVGDKLEITTLDCVYRSTRAPAQVVTDPAGNKFERPECCIVNVCIRRELITAANVGLVDDADLEKIANSKKQTA